MMTINWLVLLPPEEISDELIIQACLQMARGVSGQSERERSPFQRRVAPRRFGPPARLYSLHNGARPLQNGARDLEAHRLGRPGPRRPRQRG